MFQWLRLKVRNSILAGVNDAIEALSAQGGEGHDDALEVLQERVRLLAGPGREDAAEKATGRRKASA